MRVAFVATVILVAALAGCSGKKGDSTDLHVTCPNGTELHSEDFPGVNSTGELLKKCTGSGAGSKTNTTTSSLPNVLPVLTLTVTDDGGNATNVTLVDGNLTFSAAGSTDPDGNITGIAVSVTDSNTTRTGTLYDPATKAFKSATFKFDRQGVVNVTIALVDDRAGFTVNQTKVFVNSVQMVPASAIQIPLGSSPTEDDPCSPSVDDPLVNANMYKRPTFQVAAGVSFVTAVVTTGDAEIGVCSPPESDDSSDYGTLISDVGSSVTTLAVPDYVFIVPPATKSYGIGTFATEPGADPVIEVTVHYEPRPTA